MLSRLVGLSQRNKTCETDRFDFQSNLIRSIARPRLPEHHFFRVPQSRYEQRIFVTRIRSRLDFNGKMLGSDAASFIHEIADEIDLNAYSTTSELGRFGRRTTSVRTAIDLAVFGQGLAKISHRLDPGHIPPPAKSNFRIEQT